MNTTAKIALAASGGYLLGRTKKMKLALAFGMFLAGQKLPKSPIELVQQGAGALAKNEQFKELSQQVTGSLLDAGKAAAGRSAERWLTGVGDRLRDGLPGPDSDRQDETDQSEDNETEDSETEDSETEDAGSEDTGSEETDSAEDEDTDSEDTDRADSDSDGRGASRTRSAGSRTSGRSRSTAAPARKSSSGRSRTGRSTGSSARQSGSGSRSRAAKESR